MRPTRFTALVLLAIVGLAGCSSGKPSATATPSTTPTSAPAPSTTTRPASNDPFCNFVQTYNDRFGRVNPSALSDPQQFRTVLQDATAAIKEAAGAAPASIRTDVALVSQAMQKLMDSFQQVNFDITRIQVAAFTQLQTPEFIAAGQRIDDYTRQNCT